MKWSVSTGLVVVMFRNISINDTANMCVGALQLARVNICGGETPVQLQDLLLTLRCLHSTAGILKQDLFMPGHGYL